MATKQDAVSSLGRIINLIEPLLALKDDIITLAAIDQVVRERESSIAALDARIAAAQKNLKTTIDGIGDADAEARRIVKAAEESAAVVAGQAAKVVADAQALAAEIIRKADAKMALATSQMGQAALALENATERVADAKAAEIAATRRAEEARAKIAEIAAAV